MTIRFDDSLPKFVNVVFEQLGRETLSTGVVLRDSTGRLAFFAPSELDQETIEALSLRLRDELGPYARTDRVVAGVKDYGAERVLSDPSALLMGSGENRFRLIDRRLVGAD